MIRARRHRLADERRAAAVAPLLDGVAAALRAGAGLRDALHDAAERGPLSSTVRAVLARVDGGVPLRAALDEVSVANPQRAVRLAATALALGVETGGATAASLEALAQAVRDEQALAAEVRALSAPMRASALVIASAPVAFAALVATIDPRAGGALLFTPFGRCCLLVGVVLDGVGLWWMRALLEVRP